MTELAVNRKRDVANPRHAGQSPAPWFWMAPATAANCAPGLVNRAASIGAKRVMNHNQTPTVSPEYS
ncbi:MAG: hypothetical protein OXU42_17310, partial [Deltaproteobacteria bacterium]|nr:hypothetical protein [Deltaproteobacteria bacterium]